VQHNPFVDKVHHFHKSIKDTIDLLAEEKFDLIIDLQKNINSFRIKKGLNTAHITFDKLNIKKWILVNLKLNKLPNIHLVDRYFISLQPLGIKNDGKGLDYFILPEDEYDALSIVDGLKYDVLVLGANYFTKRIPLNKCEEIIQQSQNQIILLGGKDVSETADILAEKFPEKTINLCGKIGLGNSAGVIKHAHKVITGDTGLMHIAAALQKEIYILWGNTTPSFGMYPYYGSQNKSKSTSLEVEGLKCRPCSKLGFDSCPKGHFKCMLDQNIAAINH
jgi:ADP-heptose:LPS heptosyltransferase